MTFFCGGSRNFSKFIQLFDEVFVLDVDIETLHRRLDQRPPDEWGSKRSERDLVVRLHATKEDIPRTGIVIDATRPLVDVVDEILRHIEAPRERSEERTPGRATAMGQSSMGVRMRRPTLFLTVGLPGTGKTTEARRIEVEKKALRLTKDEWVKALYGLANPPSASDVIEGRLIEIGLRALELGIDVVIDFGLWDRDERSALRQAAADLGATVELHYFELTPAEQRKRLDRRHAQEPHTTWQMSDDDLAEWAAIITIPTPGELDGSEPIDAPPPGFATWEEWRSHRWPPSASQAR